MKTKKLIRELRSLAAGGSIEKEAADLMSQAADRLEMLSVMSKKVYGKLREAREQKGENHG